LDHLRYRFEDELMQRIKEMLRLEEVRYAIEGGVVQEDGAEHALFELQIVWRLPGGHSGYGGERVDAL
jgi:hypothetical protein